MAGWKFFKGTRENWFSHELYNWMDAMDLRLLLLCLTAVIHP